MMNIHYFHKILLLLLVTLIFIGVCITIMSKPKLTLLQHVTTECLLPNYTTLNKNNASGLKTYFRLRGSFDIMEPSDSIYIFGRNDTSDVLYYKDDISTIEHELVPLDCDLSEIHLIIFKSHNKYYQLLDKLELSVNMVKGTSHTVECVFEVKPRYSFVPFTSWYISQFFDINAHSNK